MTAISLSSDGMFYFFAMGYSNCTLESSIIPPQDCPCIYRKMGGCGFRTDHTLGVYSSPNLVDWTLVSAKALPLESRPFGVYFRPKVVRHPDGQFVLWINYLDGLQCSRPINAYPTAGLMVATSDSPAGPFAVVPPRANLGVEGAGDFVTFVDKSNPFDAYVAYDAWTNDHKIVIEKLTADFLDSLGSAATTGELSQSKQEAPVLFQRGSYYYLMFGHTCCFCREGGGAHVMVASHPLGPWRDLTELNPRNRLSAYHKIRAQNSFVFEVPTEDGIAALGYVGD